MGTTNRCSSSTNPALIACAARWGPPTEMSRDAVAFIWRTASLSNSFSIRVLVVDAVANVFALTLVVAELSWQPYVLSNKTWSAAASLPVQLCDVAAFVAAAALLWRQLALVEVAYFWGLGGTLQAVLTPDLRDHFPSFPYLQFYVTHGLVILAALFLVFGFLLQPRPGAVRRIFVLTVVFATVVGLIVLATGGNYM